MYDGMVITIVTEVKGYLCCATLGFDLYCIPIECRSEFTTIRCSVQDEISVYCFLPFILQERDGRFHSLYCEVCVYFFSMVELVGSIFDSKLACS